MTPEEARKRAEVVRKTQPRDARTLAEYSLFHDILDAIAHGGMSYGNAKVLASVALEVKR